MNTFTRLAALACCSLPALVCSTAHADEYYPEEEHPRAYELTYDIIIPLVNSYDLTVRDQLIKFRDEKDWRQRNANSFFKQAKHWARAKEFIDGKIPNLESQLIGLLQHKDEWRHIRRVLFNYRVLQHHMRSKKYYGDDNFFMACLTFVQAGEPYILFLHQHRFDKKKCDPQMTEYMVNFQDREMLLHDARYILGNLLNKVVNHNEALTDLERYIPMHKHMMKHLQFARNNYKEILDKAYILGDSGEWIGIEHKGLSDNIKKLQKMNKPQYKKVIETAKSFL